MPKPVTLEYLSKQMDRMLAEIEAMHEDLRETAATMQRCIAKARDVQELLDEVSSLMASYATD